MLTDPPPPRDRLCPMFDPGLIPTLVSHVPKAALTLINVWHQEIARDVLQH